MRTLTKIAAVIPFSLGVGLIAAWVLIPFLTTEVGPAAFVLGTVLSLVGSFVYLAREARRPDANRPP